MCNQRAKSRASDDGASEYSAFARSSSEFHCLRGFRSADSLFAEPIQSFTTRLLAGDWCHEVRSMAVQSPRRNSCEGEVNPVNF